MSTNSLQQNWNSSIFRGQVHHQRYQPARHGFSYPMYMLGLDLDELDQLNSGLKLFAVERFAPFSFRRNDYIGDSGQPLKQSVLERACELGADVERINRVMLIGQVRCFGLYFSPVNLYFLYQDERARYMLAEVHNTPWNETHCYLVSVENPQNTPKEFHVSPFMDMDMQYRWKIVVSDERVLVHIENWRQEKLFDATLSLAQSQLTPVSLFSVMRQWPVMTLTILRSIYWQALKLFIKRVPYHSHP